MLQSVRYWPIGNAWWRVWVLVLALGALLFYVAPNVHAQTTVDWTALECGGGGWTDPPAGAGGPATQVFTDVGCTGVDMSVSYSGNMYDNDSTPNVYADAAPVPQLATSLRWTNNRADTKGAPGTANGPTTVKIEFSQPVYLDDFTVASLSRIRLLTGTLVFFRYEWMDVRMYDEDGNLIQADDLMPSTYTAPDGTIEERPNSPVIVDNATGIYNLRGTSQQGTCANVCGYDRLTFAYVSTPVKRIELVHFATNGPNINDPRTAERTSVAIEPFTLTVPDDFDWGDAPDTGPGVGVGNYNTLASDNGPVHIIDPNIYLGTLIDKEDDGQPNVNADGDDINPPTGADDEDGVNVTDLTLVEGETAKVRVTATNLTAGTAILYGWIDFNGNGLFEASESASAIVLSGSNQQLYTLDFGLVPPNGLGMVYSRFRLSTDSTASEPVGSAGDGEVEDYAVGILATEQIDWGDAPDSGGAPAPGSYNTLMNNSGPSHVIVDGLSIGAIVDGEEDGQPTTQADGDDTDPPTAADDEDGVQIADLAMVQGESAIVTVNVTNLTGADARLYGWIDFDGNGVFDVGEQASVQVLNGVNNLPFNLNFGVVPANGLSVTYARFRLSTDDAAGAPTGRASDGEVEDYRVTIEERPEYDWGDAVNGYKTLAANDGPRHRITGTIYMGALIDSEEDGQPTTVANGDDTNPTGAPNDEDGVTIADLALVEGAPDQVRVTVTNLETSAAILYGWIDFDGNGVFDPDERAEVPVLAGTNGGEVVLDFGAVPTNGLSQTAARFRLSRDGAAAEPFGLAADGEVEDYPVTISVVFDWADAPDTGPGTGSGNYNTLADDNGPSHKLIGSLYIGNMEDAESDGQPTVNADGDDANPGGQPDDEDGVSGADLALTTDLNAEVNVNVTNMMASAAILYGWIDFNGNGIFEPSESAQTGVPAGTNNGSVLLDFGVVPDDGILTTYARFRLSTDNAAASPTGPAADGEVEDYIVSITSKPAAVELAAFNGTFVGDKIVVTWATSLEFNTLGFQIYRGETSNRDGAARINQGMVAALGASGGYYRFDDVAVAPGAVVYYWLAEVDQDGQVTEFGPIAVRAAPASESPHTVFLPLVSR